MAGAAITPELEHSATDQRVPLYHVILLDDDAHTYDYVIEMLGKVFGFSESKAMSHAVEVDTNGTTILLTCELQKAEHKRCHKINLSRQAEHGRKQTHR